MSENAATEQLGTPSGGGGPKNLGLARWVQMAFMGLALVLFWLLDKVVTIVWDKFAEPKPLVVSVVSLVVGGATALLLYRHETVSRLAHEVVGELAKVTWPSRDEVRVATIVVVITSIIASIIVGAYDAAWSALTDLIYKV